MTTIHEAARDGDLDTVKNLDQRNVSLEAVDEDGCTPLHWGSLTNIIKAAFNGHLEIVKYLDQRNVSLEAVDEDGCTPLHLAAYNGHLEIVKYLDQRNVSLEAVDNSGWTPLHLAAYNGHLEIVKYLDQRNVSLEAVNQFGSKPLHKGSLTTIIKAAFNGHLEIVKYLDQRNVSLEAVDEDGWTPLHIAARWGKLEIVKYLGERNVSLEAVDEEGETPLHLGSLTNILKAALNGHLEIVKYLLVRKASLNNLNFEGLSVIDSVATEEYLDVLKWFVWNDQFVIDNCGYSGSPNDYVKRKDVIRYLSDKILFSPQPFHTKFDNSLETLIDGQLCCKIEYIRGVHVLYHPVILNCSHAVCLRCIFDLVGQWYLPGSSCCINCINSIRLDELNDIKNSVYKFYIDNLSDNTFYSRSVDALQSSFKILIDNRENETEKFFGQLKYFEDEIEIKVESLKNQFDLLKKRIRRNTKKTKLNCKNIFNWNKNQEHCLDDVLRSERFALSLSCLKKVKIQLNKPIRSNIGFVKSLPFGIPGYRIKIGDLRIQKKRFLLDMYEKFKEKKAEIYKFKK